MARGLVKTVAVMTRRFVHALALFAATHVAAGDGLAFAAGVETTFVLHDVRTDRTTVVNPKLAEEAYLPCSTFKIPNTLIGLTTGVIPDERFALKWDGKRYEIAEWNRDHDLASAMKNSVVWFYQEIARRIGPARMRKYLDLFQYGNRDTCCAVDEFWLRGKLRITPRQQVDFLRRMEAGQLPVKAEHVALVRRLITLESTPAYTLQGKAGSGVQDGRSLGWLLGFVETPAGKWIYAFLAVGAPGKQVPAREARVTIVKKLLAERGILPREVLSIESPGEGTEVPSAARVFERLRALVGDWSAPTRSGKEIRVSYRLVAADSALVETYVTPSGKETLTVYHPDGTRLLATHYCAQGNQPRLQLTPAPSGPRVVFEFVDATNLRTPQASRLQKIEMALTDADHFTKSETYRESGKDETETLQFARVKAAVVR